jgi:F-type H+-transporting ATPase subunit b
MKKLLLTGSFFALIAAPAFAEEEGPFFSLGNAEFVVTLAFIVFVAAIIYFGVPKLIGGMLDSRADGIRASLAEAKALRDEAKALLASYEAKSREVAAQAERIVAQAKVEAQAAADQARADLAKSIERRLAAAGEKITSAETAAIRSVRQQAVSVAVSVAAEILAKQSTADSAKASIDAAIAQVAARLH